MLQIMFFPSAVVARRSCPCMVVPNKGKELTRTAMPKWQEDRKVGWRKAEQVTRFVTKLSTASLPAFHFLSRVLLLAYGVAVVNLDELIVCPHCDAVYKTAQPEFGERAVCTRCHSVLITPRKRAGMQVIMLAFAILVLVIAAGIFPFLTISAAGTRNSVSVIDAALAFSGGWLYLLALATATVILVIPLIRVLLVLYVLIPVVFDRPPARNAAQAFRLSEALRPWSMAEIFAIGCAVALVKVVDLANVSFGPAFWMFAVLVVLVVVQDNFMCRWSVWNSLKPQTKP